MVAVSWSVVAVSWTITVHAKNLLTSKKSAIRGLPCVKNSRIAINHADECAIVGRDISLTINSILNKHHKRYLFRNNYFAVSRCVLF